MIITDNQLGRPNKRLRRLSFIGFRLEKKPTAGKDNIAVRSSWIDMQLRPEVRGAIEQLYYLG